MVAAATQEALKLHSIDSQIMYGPVAWLEVMEDHSIYWAGAWGESFSFWVATQFGEVVDLNVSAATRKRAHDRPGLKPLYSPPLLWSRDVPKFYRYQPEGIAELELTAEEDLKKYRLVLEEVKLKCKPSLLQGEREEFPNEPILCPGRRVLDDSHQTFKSFERAIAVQGIPESPF
jgi:hypothetical protein